jgi:hypothetical protein
MTYMEIATWIGVINTGLSQPLETDDKQTRLMSENMRQACCEAQLILYELAKQEMTRDGKE